MRGASDPDAAVCPICKRDSGPRLFVRKESCDLYECPLCEHLFVWPVPTAETLKRMYSFANGYQVQEATTYDENTPVLERNRESLRQIERFCPTRGRLLDVGCSSGRLLWLAKQHGWSVSGVELNEDTAQIAIDNGLDVHLGELGSANLTPNSFDAIHLGDVIEHVQDPQQSLMQASRLLKPGGVMVVVTPNHDALFPRLTLTLHRIFRIPWSHPTPPYHLHQFTEHSLDELLRRVDLKVVERQYAPCDLHYELGETHVLRECREALAARRRMQAAGRFLVALFTVGSYAGA